MKLDRIIEDLNTKKKMSGRGSGKLEDEDLTEVEKTFNKTYSPEKTFIIYGTLAPNGPNHSVIEHIKGKWQKGIVRGKLENSGWGAELGYYGFTHAGIADQKEIEVFVLVSDELVANWQFLDEFEGNGYRRILVKFELENGEIGVGNIYAINKDKF